MTVLFAQEFAVVAGIPVRMARYSLAHAAKARPWRGHSLPVVALEGQRGGASGQVWGLDLDAASGTEAHLRLAIKFMGGR